LVDEPDGTAPLAEPRDDSEQARLIDIATGRTVSADAGVVPDNVNSCAALVYTDTGTEVHHARH
jgi:hypothetical protein